ncbi:hypothetical protein DV736_g2363, partial [Chaetothyriales sp. CBS 134916]
MDPQTNRPHRASKPKKQKQKGSHNAKAFAVANPGRLAKQAVRTSDLREKRLHVPQVDRLPEEAPPIVVAVVGPPGVGKTTLIKSLVKRYSKQTLSHPTGPITIVTSKRRRLTFIECPADSLAAMLDVAKIADIVLLLIDGNYGFEMETMEFLNALSVSGMPGNVFGILTHLDLFKKQSTLRLAKKRLKHRFWSELYHGAKLFYLSGVINGRYPDREVHNLSRFLSVMKNPRPLVWRNSHPYCLADRFLDVTRPTAIEENAKCDRQIALYGYLRGTNFPALNARVHVPGVGDLTKQKVLFAPMSDVGGVLVDKDAVYIDLKTNTFDRNADDLEDRGLGEQLMVSLQNERKLLGQADDGLRLFQSSSYLQHKPDDQDTGRKHKRGVRSFTNQEAPLNDGDEAGNEDDDEGFVSGDASDDEMSEHESHDFSDSDRKLGLAADHLLDNDNDDPDLAFADTDSDLGSASDPDLPSDASDSSLNSDEDDGGLRWKDKLAQHAQKSLVRKVAFRIADLSKFMYDLSLEPGQVYARWSGHTPLHDIPEDDDQDDEAFFTKTNIEDQDSFEDRQTPKIDSDKLADKWDNESKIEALKARFTRVSLATGANATQHASEDDQAEDQLESDEGDGEFVDLEAEAGTTGQPEAQVSLEEERARNAKRKEELKLRFEEEDREGFANGKSQIQSTEHDFGEDEWYDAQKAMLQKQLDINRSEFDSLDPASRARSEGFKAGTYARIVLDKVPYEFARSFNPRYPIIVGGLSPTEDRFGFVQVRIKRHRWHKKTLKTNDPLIFSLGWRRFQTLPIYSISDSRTRNRMLKYTPEHMHCFGTFYGPLVAPNTGFCCVQSLSNSNPGFRIAATGVVLNVDETTEIVKKLKMTGTPYKIFRNTAFIRDMFNSSIEIAKFEGASIRTVSGIRGQIKRALSKPEGHFRATFEDKILMSDLVFLRAWYPVQPHRFYNPVTNLLDAPAVNAAAVSQGRDEIQEWQAMRLTGAVRASLGLPTPQQKDSAYTPVERATRHFNPLRVPRALAADLPFKSQITQHKARKVPTYLQKRAVVLGGEEKKARELMQKLITMRNDKAEKRAKKQEERRQLYRDKVAENLEKKGEREKRERDEFWQREGRKRKRPGDTGGAYINTISCMTGIDLGGPVGQRAPAFAATSATDPSPPPHSSLHVDSHFDDHSSQGSSISLHPPPSTLQQSATEVLGISIPRLQHNDLTPPSSNASLAQLDDHHSAHASAKPILSQPVTGSTTHDAATIRPGSQSPHSSDSHEGLAGRKRTATGDLKIAPPSTHHPRPNASHRAELGHVRTTSTVSSASSNVTEISTQLRTRLKYAMIKVQNGWQTRSLDELESIATDSPRSTVSGFQHVPDRPLFASPHGRANPSFRRKWSDSSSYESSPSDPLGSTPNANSRVAPSQPTNGFNTRALAPPADIKPGARRRPTPNDGLALALLGLTASPIPQGPSPAVRTSTSQRTPSQNAAMEADAVETLLFMASPNNSGYHPHTYPSHESSLRSTQNCQTSPLRTKFSQISASSPKRVAFQDHAAPALFKTREAQIDHMLDTMPDDSEDDFDLIPYLKLLNLPRKRQSRSHRYQLNTINFIIIAGAKVASTSTSTNPAMNKPFPSNPSLPYPDSDYPHQAPYDQPAGISMPSPIPNPTPSISVTPIIAELPAQPDFGYDQPASQQQQLDPRTKIQDRPYSAGSIGRKPVRTAVSTPMMAELPG